MEKTFGVRLRLKTLKLSVYVKRGPFMVRRDALEPYDPDYPLNWLRTNFPNEEPARWGFRAIRYPRDRAPDIYESEFHYRRI